MAPSLSDMKMMNLLVGVILGLLAVVHTTPVTIAVTQIPTKAEDVVFREAMTEGFLIENPFQPSLTTESPRRNATTHETQQLFSEPEGSAGGVDSKGSETSVLTQHGGDHYATTVQSVSHAQSTFTVPSRNTDDSSSSTIQSPQSGFTSSSVPDEDNFSGFDFLSTQSLDLESVNEEVEGQYPATSSTMTSTFNTETSTASSTSTDGLIEKKAPRLFAENEGSGSTEEIDTASSASTTKLIRDEVPGQSAGNEGSGDGTSTVSSTFMNDIIVQKAPELFTEGSGSIEEIMTAVSNPNSIGPGKSIYQVHPSTSPQVQSTPGWIIILGFIVGVAALVLVCVAIATREKWNGPNQVPQLETKTGSSNQQRELEMETFLHKEQPRENGKASEYTVIPLDELPESYSSH